MESTWRPLASGPDPENHSSRPSASPVPVTRGIRKGRHNVLQMVRSHTGKSRLPPTVNCHSSGVTCLASRLTNGGALVDARAGAAHEPSQTTRLYDRAFDRNRQARHPTGPAAPSAVGVPGPSNAPRWTGPVTRCARDSNPFRSGPGRCSPRRAARTGCSR